MLAFEGGSSRGRDGSLYIYRSVPTTKEKWAKQAVLKVDDGLGLDVSVTKEAKNGSLFDRENLNA